MEVNVHMFQLTTCILLILIIIIIIIPSSSCSSLNGETDTTNCDEDYTCGDILGVNYPFWGRGPFWDQGPYWKKERPRFCGRDNFHLECRDNQYTWLVPFDSRRNSTGYRVLEIDKSSLKMRIVLGELWNNICPKSSPSSFDLNITLISGLNYAPAITFKNIFYGCSPEVQSTRPLPSSTRCHVRGTNHTDVFIGDEIDENGTGCAFRILVPFHMTAAAQLWVTNITLQEAVNQGFNVHYRDAFGGCSACQASGGSCGFHDEFLCHCGDTTHPFTCKDNRKSHLIKSTIGCSVAGIGMLICLGICYTMYRKSLYKTKNKCLETFLQQCGSLTTKRYNYSDIRKMTHGFRNKLGEGGYGGVYKGNLSDGRVVAVKILKEAKGNGEDFINEVASISQTSHVNVVSLLGYCLDESKRALIYDFMPNGSLEKYIHGDDYDHLGLEKLYQIAVGIAKGLEYLHRGCNTRILHFDIKPHNILLNEDFCPKISDFGLAKLCTRKDSIVSLFGARGTIGYIAPEVCSRNFGEVSHKSDVYSYGMMVLEMVGGRKNVNADVSHISQIYFPSWAYQRILLDDDLKLQGITNKEEEETARKMILVGLWCIQTDPTLRPSMSNAIDMLEGSLEALQVPPKPFFCTTDSERHSSTAPVISLKPSLVSPSSSTVGSSTTSAIL